MNTHNFQTPSQEIKRNKSSILLCVSVFGGIFCGAIIYNQVALAFKDYRPGDIGLGIATTTHVGMFQNNTVSEVEGDFESIIPAFNKFKSQGKTIGLWMGNSQLHAINYYTPGDKIAVAIADSLAEKDSSTMRFLQLSSPNVNMQEMLIYYLSLRQRSIIPNWLVIGVNFRCFHFVTMRETFEKNLLKLKLDSIQLSPKVEAVYRRLIEQQTVKGYDANKKPLKNESLQDRSETLVLNEIEKHWEAYRYRGNLKSRIRILPGQVYQRYSSTNNYYPASEANIEQNLEFLNQLLALCKKDGVKVLLFAPPIPQSQNQSFYYDKKQYASFLSTMARCANENDGIYYADASAIIKNSSWGQTERGWIDIFHFKEEGHTALATFIEKWFNDNGNK